jgi:hypothetical protein
VTVVIGLIFFSLTYLGIRKARQSLLKIMVDEARALMEGLALSSSNAIQAGLLLESLTEEKFADVAEAARFRLADTEDPDDFRMFGEESGLLSIDFLDSNNAIWVEGIGRCLSVSPILAIQRQCWCNTSSMRSVRTMIS